MDDSSQRENHHALSERELMILRLMADGLSNQEIADRLFLALNTVKWYIRQIYDKLGTHTRTQTVARARQLRLITDGDGALIPSILPEDHEPPENPYKGLHAFQEADASDFFGREALVERLLARLAQTATMSRLLAVVGPSGSGKSSVVNAGLIPALRRGALPGSDKWLIVEILPGAHPLEELELTLLRLTADPPPSLLSQLREDKRGMLRAVRRVLPDDDSELLLVIDQFEEVFTLVESAAARQHFLDSIYAAVSDARSPLRVVITLRADFYDRPLLDASFGALLHQRTEVVLPLTAEELERVITRPAARVGVQVESGVVSTIIADVNQQPGGLPLLQYALTELFDRVQGNLLKLDDYRAIGGVSGALGRRAEALLEGLDERGQEATRQIWLRLVMLGEGVEETRRRAMMSELLSVGDDANRMDDIIQTFAAYRFLTLDRDPRTGEATVEVAHEALIRVWKRLRGWLDESRADLRLQRLLAGSTAEWVTDGRDSGFLLGGSRLAQFEEWASKTTLALTTDERAYLEASLTERERQACIEQERQAREKQLERRSQNSLRVLVVVLLLAALGGFSLAGVAVNQSQIAQIERDNARRSAVESQYTALTAGSQAAFATGNTDLAIALALEAVHLDPQATRAQVALSEAAYAPGTIRRFVGHNGAVPNFAISPDGHTLISTSDDMTMILWDIETAQIIRRYEGHKDKVMTAAFSPDGRTILSGSNNFAGSKDNRVILWNVESGQIIRQFEGHTAGVWAVAFAPDGRRALSGGTDAVPILWDIQTGQIIRRFGEDSSGHTDQVESLTISPDGRTALTGSWDGTLILWDIENGAIIRRFGASGEGHITPVIKVVFSPDGRLMLSGAQESNIILWDITTGEVIRRFNDGQGWVFGLAFSMDGHRALSAGVLGSVVLWDVNSGEILHRFQGHTGPVVSVAFAPDGRAALSSAGGTDNSLRLWDLEEGQITRQFVGHKDWVEVLAESHDGHYAFSTSDDGTAILWNVQTGQEVQRYPTLTWGVDFSPDGQTALLSTVSNPSGANGDLVLVDVETGREIRRWASPNGGASVAFSPDGRTAVAGGMGRIIILWDVATGQEIRRFTGYENEIPDHVSEGTFKADFNEDGSQVWASFIDGTVAMWDAASGEQIRELPGTKGITGTFSGNSFGVRGAQALVGMDDGTAVLWDLTSTSVTRRLTSHNLAITLAQITPDGRLGIIGSVDNSTTLSDLQTGELLRRWSGPNHGATALAFGTDGNDALVGFPDGRVELWRIDATLDELIAWVKANRYIPELTCEQRELYKLDQLCSEVTAAPTT